MGNFLSVSDYSTKLEKCLNGDVPNVEDLVKVAKVKDLYVYPVKSCRGIRVESAECSPLGLKVGPFRDRCFMLIQENGNFLTARQEPTLVQVVPSFLGENKLCLDAPKKETLKINLDDLRKSHKESAKHCRVWGQDTTGIDCGDEASRWFSTFLNREVRLVFYADTLKPKFCHERERFRPLVKKTDAAAFADFSGYMLMSNASVDDVNTRLTKKVEMKRFRPNIVVEDSDSYSEDKWKNIRINDAWFRSIKPCQRCVMITTDSISGERDSEGEALNVLRTYRKAENPELKKFTKDSPLLGINLGIDRTGKIAVGDSIYVNFKGEHELLCEPEDVSSCSHSRVKQVLAAVLAGFVILVAIQPISSRLLLGKRQVL